MPFAEPCRRAQPNVTHADSGATPRARGCCRSTGYSHCTPTSPAANLCRYVCACRTPFDTPCHMLNFLSSSLITMFSLTWPTPSPTQRFVCKEHHKGPKSQGCLASLLASAFAAAQRLCLDTRAYPASAFPGLLCHSVGAEF